MARPVLKLRAETLRLLAPVDEAESLVDALKVRKPWAERALVEDYTAPVERLITRVLGPSSDLDDLVQEVFIRALARVDQLRDEGVGRWLGAFAVNVAREALRKKRRWRWLVSVAPEDAAESRGHGAAPDVMAAMRSLYRLLDRMEPDDRVVFTLRAIEGLELLEVAALADMSLSTVKRRFKRAESWLFAHAARDVLLSDWVRAS
ncbi:MAG: sigma-70 family RNA polymerase sigma factor [Polyangiaceae bacterium]|nr:sigma-70 family RNA polymerase sigma factor [Polyangiaceae bacterium]